MSGKAKKLINELNYGDDIKLAVMNIAPDLDQLQGVDPSRIAKIRYKLNAYSKDIPGKHKPLVYGVLYVVKKLNHFTAGEIPSHKTHTVSDHAFCSAIRRLGYDLDKYKNMALEEALEAGLVPVWAGPIITTFLPKGVNK